MLDIYLETLDPNNFLIYKIIYNLVTIVTNYYFSLKLVVIKLFSYSDYCI